MLITKTRLVGGAAALALLAPGAAVAGDALSCKATGTVSGGPIKAAVGANAVDLTWFGSGGQPMALRLGIVRGKPVIERLAVNGQVIGENLGIEYKVTTGFRRMSNQQMQPLKELGVEITDKEIEDHKWDAFWDSPLDMRKPAPARPGAGFGGNPPPVEGVASQPGLPRDPKEVAHTVATYAADGCVVTAEGQRLSVAFPKMSTGVFNGDLVLTVFNGSNLIKRLRGQDRGQVGRLQVQRRRHRPADQPGRQRPVEGHRQGGPGLHAEGQGQRRHRAAVRRQPPGGRQDVRRRHRRLPAAAHLLLAREHEDNPGNNWYRKDGASTFSIGVRQPEMETEEHYFANWALYSAPPGTEQHMSVYFFPTAGTTEDAFAGALAFTSNDRYPSLPATR